MSKQTDVLNTCLKIFQIFGLDQFKKRTSLLFIATFPVYTTFLTVVAFNVESIEEKLKLIQYIMPYIIIAIKVLNVLLKFEDIKRLIEKIKTMLLEIDDESFLECVHQQGMQFLKFCAIYLTSLVVTQLVSLALKETTTPLWIPNALTSYKDSVIYFYWFANAFPGLYMSIPTLSIDFLVIYLLLCLKAYSKLISKSFEAMPVTNEKDMEEKLMRRVKQFHELKTYSTFLICCSI
jgi:hypothetical protein